MALNKKGVDWKAIRKDQKAIDSLPNRGRASVDHGSKSKALEAKKGQCAKCGKDHPTTGHSAATIYHTPTPGLEEWRKKNHPFKK